VKRRQAGEALIAIAQQLGDLDDIQNTALLLLKTFGRLGQLDTAHRFLDWADRLTVEALKKDSNNQKLLEYHFEHRMYAARLQHSLLMEKSPLSSEQKNELSKAASENIEDARHIALDLGQDGRLAEAYLERAQLQEAIGDLIAADQSCRGVDLIQGCPPGLRAASFLILGRIAARQESFQEAMDSLDLGLKILGEDHWDEIRVRYLNTRGAVKEKLGDKPGAIQDYEEAVKRTMRFRDLLVEESRVAIFELAEKGLERLFILNAEDSPLKNSRQALYWAEFAKSRAMAELLGHSTFTMPKASFEMATLYDEEQKLLAELHAGRVYAVSDAGKVSLDQSYAMQTKRARLDQLWSELEPRYPEYVELRRGAVPSWSEIIEMTAG
jgi:tetratricopeptide (TPR) repeat protein